ncbi:hypothetical protein JYU34_012166 [Plutella xylostella]|uniref:C2H2-type domain-containing protein n=1 Tax=Plutella xylostella TaxID=51655 RepID=A0ABQ7QEH9_PLUXY|nr:hypothetical protein JYU34_012166 [Plutella xylostella]
MIQACVFCLSQDRDLLIIDESLYLTLYPSFKEENIEFINYLQAENLLKLCWECHGRISNFKTFLQAADRSLNNLKMFMAFPLGDLPKSESKLQITAVDSIDIAPSVPPLLPPKAEQNVYNADNTIVESRGQELNENGVSVSIVKLEITPDIDNFNRDDNDDSDMETSPEQLETQGSVLHAFSNNNFNLSAIKSERSKLNIATTSKNHNDDDSGEDDKPLAVWVSPLPTVITKPAGKKVLYPRRAASTNKLIGTPGSSKFSKMWVSNEQATSWHREELRRAREASLSFVHECDACERLFAEEEELNRHVDDAHSEKAGQYTCDICLYRFPDQTKLEQHMEAHYVNYKCKTCSFECRQLTEMQQHVKDSHIIVPKTVCTRCKIKFASKAELKRHFKTCATYKCTYCDAKFPVRDTYLRHVQMHKSDPDGIYCEVCDVFCSPSWYRKHLRTTLKHVSKDSFKHECEMCHDKFPTASRLGQHMVGTHKRPGPNACDLCHKSFFKKSALMTHRATIHKIGPVVIEKKKKDKVCETCGKGFSSTAVLANHIRTHTGERPWHCPDCPATFKANGTLQAHLMSIHDKTVNRLGQEKKADKICCDVCGRQFISPSALRLHYDFHHLKKKTKHHCEICDKGPYKCRSCDVTYSARNNMYEHYKLKHLHLKKDDRVTIKNLFKLDKEVEVIRLENK